MYIIFPDSKTTLWRNNLSGQYTIQYLRRCVIIKT